MIVGLTLLITKGREQVSCDSHTHTLTKMNDNKNMDSCPEINEFCLWIKKSLKIPKGLSEFVYRRTDNTMAKRKRTKEQTTIYKTCIHV